MLKTVGCFLLLCLVGSPLQNPARKSNAGAAAWPPPSPPAETLQVTFKLDASAHQVRLAEKPVTLRLELRNDGTEPFYASRTFSPFTNAPAYVVIEVTNQAKVASVLDSMDVYLGLTASFRWWVAIEPLHYYGTSLLVDPLQCDALRTPGTYELTARYVSEGGTVPPSPEWDVPIHWAWKGEIKSNSIKIKILPSKNHLKDGKK